MPGNGGVPILVFDAGTVKKAKQGDADSFAKLYDGIALDLYKVALYTLKNPQDAQDAVSETFIEAYKGISNLRDENSFKNWMMTILSARCKRIISRYIKERKNVNFDEIHYLSSPERDNPGSERLALSDALDKLSAEERQIVVLASVQGYTSREIAQMMGMPQGTVSSKLYRSLKKMRQYLEQ